MTEITEEFLKKEIESLEKLKQQCLANFNAAEGALMQTNKLLNEFNKHDGLDSKPV